MPFAYYGAKHSLAQTYPRPVFDHIIEPFAGSAGYSCYWAPRLQQDVQVTLYDKAPEIVALWHRLQHFEPGEASRIVAEELRKQRTSEPLVYLTSGSGALSLLGTGRDAAVTPRMISDAPRVARRIDRLLGIIRHWTVKLGDYRDIPNVEAVWHIDPPYQPLMSMAGSAYLQSTIDYAHLADWCQKRSGQVMVCEQAPAAWLPFKPHRKQINAAGSAIRTELIWHRSPVAENLIDLLNENK